MSEELEAAMKEYTHARIARRDAVEAYHNAAAAYRKVSAHVEIVQLRVRKARAAVLALLEPEEEEER